MCLCVGSSPPLFSQIESALGGEEGDYGSFGGGDLSETRAL